MTESREVSCGLGAHALAIDLPPSHLEPELDATRVQAEAAAYCGVHSPPRLEAESLCLPSGKYCTAGGGQFQAYAQRVMESGTRESQQVPGVESHWVNDPEHEARYIFCP